jgi:hypothetical protein
MEVRMTVAKTTALVAALVGALALGVFIGPFVWDRDSVSIGRSVTRATRPTADAEPASRSPRAATKNTARAESRAAAPATRSSKATVAPSEPELHQQVKPLLNRGADVAVAAEGFESGEQFATVAHASRNTAIPFMLLKHRVLTEGKSLAAAIHESKPDLDARSEANRAQAAAREDIAKLQG